MSATKAAPKPSPIASPGPPPVPKKNAMSRNGTTSKPAAPIPPLPAPATPAPAQKPNSQLTSLIGAAEQQIPPADAQRNSNTTPAAAVKRRGRPSSEPNSAKKSGSGSSKGKNGKEFRSPNDTLTDEESGGTPEKENNAAGESDEEGNGEKSSRLDCSLSRLTKKFLELVQKAPDGVVDLNLTADSLQVKKRRLYDITNVMEGIGLVEKRSKNKIQWSRPDNAPSNSGPWDPASIAERVKSIRADLIALATAEDHADEEIRQVQIKLKRLTEEEPEKRYSYVTPEDIRSIPYMATDALISIRAPSGSKLEVADPDDGMEAGKRRYQISLKSSSGPIDVFVVGPKQEPQLDGSGDVVTLTQPPPPPPPPRAPGSPNNMNALRLPSAQSSSSQNPTSSIQNIISSSSSSAADSLDPNSFFSELGVTDLFLEDSMLHL